MVEVIPTILVKSQKEFKERFQLVKLLVERVQWDIMDGVFVENTTFSDEAVLKELDIPPRVEADLMVSDPQNWIRRFVESAVDRLVFHVESTAEPEALIEEAKAAGFEVGLTLDPATPLKQVWDCLPKLDLFQVMGVRSGWGGQEFVPEVLDKISKVRRAYPELPISVDGGVNNLTALEMVSAGATRLCAGSYIFNSDNIAEAILTLKKTGEE
jgi:ribulose-phosphate 3-epimerase